MRLPKVKTPKFVADLGRELQERRLLPLIALLVVAIVAVPIALSKSTPPPSGGGGRISGAALTSKASHLMAVPDTPGLRDYRRRLSGQEATDPFKPRDSGSSSPAQSASNEASGEEASATSALESAAAGELTSADGATPGGEITAPAHVETRYFTHAIDVRVVNSTPGASSSAKSKPVVHYDLPTLSPLPGRKAPAVIFMGVNDGRALLTVSADVRPTGGGGRCIFVSAGICQLMLLKPGQVEAFSYGDGGHTVRIKLLKIELVVTHRPLH
jgi:hypothetical protein